MSKKTKNCPTLFFPHTFLSIPSVSTTELNFFGSIKLAKGTKGREDGMDGGREKQKKGRSETDYQTKENRGEMRSGAPAREIRKEGGEDKKKEKRKRKKVDERAEEQRKEM